MTGRGHHGKAAARSRHNAGFTLLEFVAGIAVSAIVGTALVGTIFQLNTASADGLAQQSVTVQVRTATRWLSRDVAGAAVSDLADGGAAVASARFDWTDATGPHYCGYALSGSGLVRTCDAGTSTVSRNLSGLSFTRSGNLVTVGFTVTAPGRPDANETVLMNLAMRGA